ncbi:aspartyl/asparaginyl beta-hydroxylase domain-containing protein [Pseudomonas sp. LB3P31]
MNSGSFLIAKNFFGEEKLLEIQKIAQELEINKANVHAEGKYAGIQWHKIDLDPKTHTFMQKIYDFLGADQSGVCVFYYLSPGAVLHAHRDLTGASSNARIRFHVPIITNDKVFFNVSKKRVMMSHDELWALDTSYLHEVRNESSQTRVHIVIECNINESVKTKLPEKNIRGKLHDVYFFAILGINLLKSVGINIWKDPKYFMAQMRMLKKFVKWKFLGKQKVE